MRAGKFNENKVRLFILEANHYQVAVYILSFLIGLYTNNTLVEKMRESKKVNVKYCKIIFYQRKVHFLIINIWAVDLWFFAIRTISYVKFYSSMYAVLNVAVSYLVVFLVL